jgi:hypothetical protein
MKTEHRDPALLSPHPILKHIPAPAKDAPEVCALADIIRDQDGHLLPLVIDEQNHILTDDSRLRWMAAKRMQLTQVPVVLQPSALAPVIALNALMHRQHYTKSALAYLAMPLLKPAFDAARHQRLEILKSGGKGTIGHSVTYAQTWEELAGKIGVSKGLFVAAKQVHAEFERDKKQYTFEVEGGADDGRQVEQTLREHFEPKLLRHQAGDEHEGSRPIGLGGVMKAIGSIRAYEKTGGVKQTSPQLELFTGGFDALAKRFRYWSEFSPAEKTKARQKLQSWLAEMPDDLRAELYAIIEENSK